MQREPVMSGDVKLQLIFQVTVLLLQPLGVVSEKPKFLPEWEGKWYVQYKKGPQPQFLTKIFHDEYETYHRYADSGTINYTETYICLVRIEDRKQYHYAVAYHSEKNKVRKCFRTLTQGLFYSPSDLLIYTSLQTAVPNIDMSRCLQQKFPKFVDILMKWPLSLNTTKCPFPSGKYQVEVKRLVSQKVLTFCHNDLSSHITVGQGHIEINSCVPGNDYARPFQNVQLVCYREIAPSRFGTKDIDRTSLVHIFAFNLTTLGSQFFVARYRKYVQNEPIRMSLQGSTIGKLRVQFDEDYNSVGSDGTGFYYRFYLTPVPSTTTTSPTSSLPNATAGNMTAVSYTGDPTTTLPWIPGGGLTRGPGNPGSPDNAENDRITAQTQTALNETLTGAAILMVIMLAVVFILANVCVIRRHESKQRPGTDNRASHLMKTPSEILRTKRHHPLTPVETPTYDVSIIPYVQWNAGAPEKNSVHPKDAPLKTASQMSLDSQDNFSEVSLPV